MTKEKRRSTLIVVGVLALVVGACANDEVGSVTDATNGTGTVEADADGIRIAIVAPSASNDLAFTQSIVDAANKMSGVAEIAVTDGTFIVEDAAAAIRDYAVQEYDLVIAHGSQYGGSLEEIAPDFPDTAFAWGTAADTFELDNVYAYEAASDQGDTSWE